MFLLRNKKDISIFRMKKAPYLLLCFSHVVTMSGCEGELMPFCSAAEVSSEEYPQHIFVEK